MPERALACSFNLEYLLVGGRDARHESRPIFMWYDWMVGGWGGRNGKDGSNATAPIFGVGLAVQPLEGAGAALPGADDRARDPHRLRRAGPVPRRLRRREGRDPDARPSATVMSYMCDRARSITWGIEGGLPSIPHGVWLDAATASERFLGAVFSNVPLRPGRPVHAAVRGRRRLRRPARARPGGGARGRRRRLRLDRARAQGLRRRRPTRSTPSSPSTRSTPRRPAARARADPRRSVAAGSRRIPRRSPRATASGEHRPARRRPPHGVILDWGTGELLPKTTTQFRAMLQRRMVAALGLSRPWCA